MRGVRVPTILASGTVGLSILAACHAFGTANDGPAPAEAGTSVVPSLEGAAPVATSCDRTKDFGVPVLLVSVSTPEEEGSPRLSDDELTIWFDGIRRADGGSATYDLLVATRSSLGDGFGPATRAPGPLHVAASHEYSPNPSSDGLRLFFEREASGGASRLFVAARQATSDPFGAATPISLQGSDGYQANPFVRGSGSELWFVATGADKRIDVFHADGLPDGGYLAAPVPGVNSGRGDFAPVLSQDGTTIYLSSDRPTSGGPLGFNVWSATREAPSSPFGQPTLVPNVNTDDDESPGWISSDGCRLYLTRKRIVGAVTEQDIYVAARPD